MKNIALCMIVASLGAIGCRDKAQDKWLKEHANVPTVDEVARSLAEHPQQPAGPSEAQAPQIRAPAASAQPQPPAPPMTGPASGLALAQRDVETVRRVRAAMVRDPALQGKMARIEVAVRDGKVILTGTVPDESARAAAKAAAIATAGARNVVENLTSVTAAPTDRAQGQLPAGAAQPRAPAGPVLRAPAATPTLATSDADTARRIRASMARDPVLRDKMALIDIAVKDGRVVLSGLVPDQATKSAAEAVAFEVVDPGNVVNDLTLIGLPAAR